MTPTSRSTAPSGFWPIMMRPSGSRSRRLMPMFTDPLPARIGAGKGSVNIGINRRERLPDGRIMIGQNPDGAVDREVGVIRIDDLAGKPIATMMAVGCHTVRLGPKT